jgi:hypothetical protein
MPALPRVVTLAAWLQPDRQNTTVVGETLSLADDSALSGGAAVEAAAYAACEHSRGPSNLAVDVRDGQRKWRASDWVLAFLVAPHVLELRCERCAPTDPIELTDSGSEPQPGSA